MGNNRGGIWKKNGGRGEYLYGNIEIDGKKHNFVAFANINKEAGDKRPDFNIMPEREVEAPKHEDEGDIPF